MTRVVFFLILIMFASAAVSAQTISPPRSVEAIATSETEIKIYWLPSKDMQTEGYFVERDGVVLATVPSTAQEYDDAGLTPDSTHTYTVRAVAAGAPRLSSAPRTYVERTFAAWPSTKTHSRTPIDAFDVVIAQASTGGVAAAIEAARRHLKVALIEPTTRIGGMPANGLSATDLRHQEHASGFFVRFRDRVKSLYAAEGVHADGMSYEPRVAQQAMKALVYEVPGIALFRRARPIRVNSHSDENRLQTHVDGLIVEELNPKGDPTGRRAELRAKVFVDATDCGDVAAWAGADFRLGREARSDREPHNGVIYYDRANDRALAGSTGKADRRMMAYSYLLTVKDYGPGADKTITKPAGYRKEDFIHTPEWKQSWAVTSGRMPGDKLELNQHPQGGDIQAINYRYPLQSYAERARIEQLYKDHVLGYLYYIQKEQGERQIGLPDDEYRDTGGFPPLLYVREGRRIIGDQLPDEADVSQARSHTRPESIGIGDYPMDSHAVRSKSDWTTPDMGEGEWWLYKQTPVHQLPVGVMIPRGLDNLYVTTAVSSTHVSFGTYRLEPVRMAFGQAAGIAADLCIRFHLSAHDVPARQIQDELLPHADNTLGDDSVKLNYYSDVTSANTHYREIQYLTSHGILLQGDNFKPDAVTTVGELSTTFTQLAARSAQGDAASEPYPLQAYMGLPADRKVLKEIQNAGPTDSPVTRAEFAHWLVKLLPHQVDPMATRQQRHYSDITDALTQIDAEALYTIGIDSVLWDNWKALDANGQLKFGPNAPITHTQLFAALYIAQIGLGPLFDDHPIELSARR